MQSEVLSDESVRSSYRYFACLSSCQNLFFRGLNPILIPGLTKSSRLMIWLTSWWEREQTTNLVTVWHKPEEEAGSWEDHVSQVGVLALEHHPHQVHCSELLVSLRIVPMDTQSLRLLCHFCVFVERAWQAFGGALLLSFDRVLLDPGWHELSLRHKVAGINNLREDLGLTCHLYHVWRCHQNRWATHHAKNYGQEEVSGVREAAWIRPWPH